MINLYYRPPHEHIFNEVKRKCIEVWKEKIKTGSYPDYISGKVERIKQLDNVEDNMMSMIAMFSPDNMILLAQKLSLESREAIYNRLIDGGATTIAIIFK